MKWMLILASFAIGSILAWQRRAAPPQTAYHPQSVTENQKPSVGRDTLGEEEALLASIQFPTQAKAKGYAATLSALLAASPGRERDQRIQQLVESWETEAPQACLEFLVSHDQGTLASSMTWHRVAKENADGAWDLLKRSKGERHVGPLLSAVFETDPEKATSLLQAATKLGFELASADEDFPWPAAKFTQWLATQAPSRIGMELETQMIKKWSETQPEAAADWYLAQSGKPILLDEAAEKLIAVRPDAFAARLPELGGRINNPEQIGTTAVLSVHRPAAVAEFLNNMAPSPTRITQTWACVNEICQTQGPAEAVAFACQLEAGGARLDALANAFHEWSRSETPQEKTRRQVAFASLSPSEQAYVNTHHGDMPGVSAFLD